MNRKYSWLVLFMAVVGSSCATSNMSNPEHRKKMAAFRYFESKKLKSGTYENMGLVEGTSCNSSAFSSASEDEARIKMRDQAIELGADGIADAVCDSNGATLTCWKTIKCIGDAIRWNPSRKT